MSGFCGYMSGLCGYMPWNMPWFCQGQPPNMPIIGLKNGICAFSISTSSDASGAAKAAAINADNTKTIWQKCKSKRHFHRDNCSTYTSFYPAQLLQFDARDWIICRNADAFIVKLRADIENEPTNLRFLSFAKTERTSECTIKNMCNLYYQDSKLQGRRESEIYADKRIRRNWIRTDCYEMIRGVYLK